MNVNFVLCFLKYLGSGLLIGQVLLLEMIVEILPVNDMTVPRLGELNAYREQCCCFNVLTALWL